MTDTVGIAGDRILSFIERIEHIDEELKALNEGKKEVFSEAKGEGFDVKVLKEILRLRKQNQDELDEQESLLDLSSCYAKRGARASQSRIKRRPVQYGRVAAEAAMSCGAPTGYRCVATSRSLRLRRFRHRRLSHLHKVTGFVDPSKTERPAEAGFFHVGHVGAQERRHGGGRARGCLRITTSHGVARQAQTYPSGEGRLAPSVKRRIDRARVAR
jgi:uncharacterized protein (UPF0335 family)